MVRLSGRGEDDFREEIEAHIALETDRLVEEGHSPEEAAVFARRKFGNVTRTQERYYESRRLAWLTHLFRDARDAVRDMKRQPTSTAAILLSLTIGIGASVSIFSLADQSLFRPLPVIEPGQIVQLRWNGRFIGGGSGFGNLLPHPFYRELRNAQDVFVDMLARSQTEAVLAIGSQSETITVEVASGSYFPTFGVLPAVGRLLTDQDDLSIGAHPVVVLSYDYWQHRFGGDPTIVGQRIRINDHPMTIIGVAQSGFRGTDWSHPSALWIPLTMNGFVRNRSRLTERRERFLHVFARMRDGTSIAQAEAQLQPWFANYLRAETELPGWPAVTAGQLNEYLSSRLDVVPAARGQARETQIEQPMIVLVFATGLCLLLASLNVANLSIARTLARRKTIALRMALGASRARILSSQLVESSMLVLFGSVLGVLVAPLISSGILTLLPNGTGAGEMGLRAGVDVRVLVAALITAVCVTLVSGAAPTWHAATVRPVFALRRESARLTAGLSARKVLVTGQFALALILLVGAMLFARTLSNLRESGPGFSTANLITFQVQPTRVGYSAEEAKTRLRAILGNVNASTDLEQAGLGRYEMFKLGSWNNPVTILAASRFVTDMDITMNAVSPGLFEALGTPIVAGRDFDDHDTREQPGWGLRSAIVNEEFVTRYLAGSDPLGVYVGIGGGADVVTDIEIVGVVRTFRITDLRSTEPNIFFPLWERPVDEGTFYVRARTSSAEATRLIRQAVRNVDPKLLVSSLRTVDDQVDRMLAAERLLAAVAGGFAIAATLLAMIGLYGLLAFTATLRQREIGIRVALGAHRWGAGGLIVREAGIMATIGAAIALPVSWGLGRLVERRLFGVNALDARSLLAATLILALVCVIASAMPARRAGTVDPADVLRNE